MKDNTLTRPQRRMPLMLRPILTQAEAKALLAQAAKESAILAQMKRADAPDEKVSANEGRMIGKTS